MVRSHAERLLAGVPYEEALLDLEVGLYTCGIDNIDRESDPILTAPRSRRIAAGQERGGSAGSGCLSDPPALPPSRRNPNPNPNPSA